MPNPVLLSANGDPDDRPVIGQETLNGETPTGIWTVSVPDGRAAGSKPLWILDGQHRINGLAGSAQKGDELPVVLLLNDDAGESYRGSDFASLFAQVTTTAKKLDELHNAWLTFAYQLDEYADTFAGHAEHRAAMQTVCLLCERAKLDSDEPNPFHNAIRFNPERPASTSTFAYGCKEFREGPIRRHYFSDAGDPLDPEDLADALGEGCSERCSPLQCPPRKIRLSSSGRVIARNCRCKMRLLSAFSLPQDQRRTRRLGGSTQRTAIPYDGLEVQAVGHRFGRQSGNGFAQCRAEECLRRCSPTMLCPRRTEMRKLSPTISAETAPKCECTSLA